MAPTDDQGKVCEQALRERNRLMRLGGSTLSNRAHSCTYDLTKFSGAIIVDVMRTHPMILLDGILLENPFFILPDEFLRKLRARRLARETRSTNHFTRDGDRTNRG